MIISVVSASQKEPEANCKQRYIRAWLFGSMHLKSLQTACDLLLRQLSDHYILKIDHWRHGPASKVVHGTCDFCLFLPNNRCPRKWKPLKLKHIALSNDKTILYTHGGPVPLKSVKVYSWMGKQPKDFTIGCSFNTVAYTLAGLSIGRGAFPRL